MPTLTIQERGKERSWTHECAEEAITIGRLPSNTIQLKTDGVSRQHAKIIADGEHFFILDLKSGNGTLLNGREIIPNEKNLLRPGDSIGIDSFDIEFHEKISGIERDIEEEITESDILEVKLLKKVLTALDKDMVPSIEVLNGTSEGKKIFFTDEMTELVIGRDPECDFPINEYVMSRNHAKVMKRWGGIAIRDMESKNGTFVNNRRVVEEYLHDGDRLALGTIVLMFRNPQEINLAKLSDIKPKSSPEQVAPQDIPGLEESEEEQIQEEEAASELEEEAPQEEEESALEEWDNLEKSMSKLQEYPTPHARVEAIKQMTPMEIGMIGLGVLMIIFALVTIVNLMAS